RLWLIDHGAALIFHHQWDGYLERSGSAFPMIKDHVLLDVASGIAAADASLTQRLAAAEIERIANLIPDDWLEGTSLFGTPREQREAYVRYIMARVHPPRRFVEEAIRAHAVHV